MLSGSGSAGARRAAVAALFGRLTAAEQEFLRNLITGNVRQGALDSVMLDAIAAAAGRAGPRPSAGRRCSAPRPGPIAVAALTGGAGGAGGLQHARRAAGPADAGRHRLPTSPPGWRRSRGAFAVDTKLDGIRIQVHKHGDEVSVFTRSLDEISARLPEVVAARPLAARPPT